MRIGVDARLLSIPMTGIGRYTYEMINALLRGGSELVLYSPAELIYSVQSGRGQHEIKAANFGMSRLGRMLWAETILPFQAAHDSLDVFWGPTHRLPHSLPRQVFKAVTIHDLVWRYAAETMRPLSRFNEAMLMPKALQRADHIITVSDNTQSDIRRAFPGMTAPITTIYPGLAHLSEPLVAETLGKWRIDRPYALFVGTLEPRKNLSRLISAFAGLPSAIRHNHCLVITGGAGWGGIDIHTLVMAHGLESEVRVTGYVTEAELATLYQNARCLAMPSLYEGFGFPLVEAMSRGVAVLTSNLSSMPEVAGDAGELINPLDESAITQGLARLLTDEDRRQTLARRGLVRSRQFDWDAAAARLLALFKCGTARR